MTAVKSGQKGSKGVKMVKRGRCRQVVEYDGAAGVWAVLYTDGDRSKHRI